MARNADNRKGKGRAVRMPQNLTVKERQGVLKVAESMSRVCSNATAEQLAEIAADPAFASTPRFFKEAMRSFGTPLPSNANRMVQNV